MTDKIFDNLRTEKGDIFFPTQRTLITKNP